jgi:dTDP-glucose 4,6-dehydratase
VKLQLPNKPEPVIRADLAFIARECEPQLRQLSHQSILITGGSGFVGRYLAETLIDFNAGAVEKCAVTLLTRRPRVLEDRYAAEVRSGEVRIMRWDSGDDQGLAHGRWDYVVHAAAPADPRSFLDDPSGNLRDMVAMAAAVARAAERSGARRALLLSSGAVYGEQPLGVTEIGEDYQGAPDLTSPLATYGEGKRASELCFSTAASDHRIARVFSLLGPYQELHGSFAVPSLMRQASEQGSLTLDSDGRAVRSYCYSADLAVVLFKLLLGQPTHDVYNVGNRQATVTVRELAEMIAFIFGGLSIALGPAPDGTATSGAGVRYVPQLDRMEELHTPRVGLFQGLVRVAHSLYNRKLIGRKPSVDLEDALLRSMD